MTYTPPEGVSIGTFTADTLPASFNAPAGAVVSYKISGTSEGTGVETENLFDKDAKDTENGYVSGYRMGVDGGTATSALSCISEYIEIQANTIYTAADIRGRYSNDAICFYNADKEYISGITYETANAFINKTFTTPPTAKYVRFSLMLDYFSDAMLVESSTAPTTYIPFGYKIPISNTSGEQQSNYDLFIGNTKLGAEEYVDYAEQKIYKMSGSTLVPTDPPVSFPPILTYKGENTLSSTETLGEVELTGDWLAIMGSTQSESIDIEFTVDAEEYIAFVTVDDDPQIQVSDTITMPSSADSFSLEVVAWGRERYTDTVYNALS